MQKKIVIADDHVLIAKAITGVIEQFSNYEVLFECANGKELTERFQRKENIPDIVLLDISMPVMDGFETAKWLKTHHPGVKVMVLTMQADDHSLFTMIKEGAAGYLNKNVHPLELKKALDTVFEKGFYYPDWATGRMLHNMSEEGKSAVPSIKMSSRETEFLAFTCTELTYKEIAEKMFCSTRTVEGYRDSLFEKLNVKTRVALALYAVKSGLFQL